MLLLLSCTRAGTLPPVFEPLQVFIGPSVIQGVCRAITWAKPELPHWDYRIIGWATWRSRRSGLMLDETTAPRNGLLHVSLVGSKCALVKNTINTPTNYFFQGPGEIYICIAKVMLFLLPKYQIVFISPLLILNFGNVWVHKNIEVIRYIHHAPISACIFWPSATSIFETPSSRSHSVARPTVDPP